METGERGWRDKEHINQDDDLRPDVEVKQEESPRRPPQSDRLKRDEWSQGAVSSLLEAYESKWVLRNRAKLKGQDWEDVARFVSFRANSTKSPKTQTQCKNKIESMKKRYRSESSAAADASSSSWPLYHRLHHLLRGAGAAPPSPHPPPPAVQALLPAIQVVQPLPPPPQPSSVKINPSLPAAPQNSHGVDRLGGIGKEQKDHGTPEHNKFSADHVSDRNTNVNDAAVVADTDSSTPALVHSDEKENNNRFGPWSERVKMKRKSAGARRTSSSEWEIADSIRWLAEVVVRSEQARMDTMRELEKMRMEAEAKRGEMDLKRTEILANTHLEIAKLFSAGLTKPGPHDPSLRTGRRN